MRRKARKLAKRGRKKVTKAKARRRVAAGAGGDNVQGHMLLRRW